MERTYPTPRTLHSGHRTHSAHIILSILLLLLAGGMVQTGEAKIPVTYTCCSNSSFTDGALIDDFEHLTLGGTQIDDFENTTNWTIAGGQSSANTEVFKTNLQGMNLSTATLGTRVTADKTGFSSDFSTTSNFGLWVYVWNVSTYNKMELYFGSHGASFTSYYICSKSGGLTNGWNAVIIDKSICTTSNGENWNNPMNITRIAIYPKSGLNTTVTLDSFANDTNNIWAVSSTQGSVAIDTTHVKTGTGALNVTGINPNNYSVLIDKPISYNFSNKTNIAFWMYVPEAPTVTNNSVTLSITSAGAAFSKSFHVASWGTQSGWNRIIFSKNQFVNSGGEDWNNVMNRLRFTLNQNVTIDDLSVNVTGERAKIIFSFDDGLYNVSALALPIMSANNQPGVSYTVTNRVGTAGYMNISQLRTLQTNGWDVSSHTSDHLSLITLDDTNLSAQLNNSYNYLINNSFRKSAIFLSYPSSTYNDNVINFVQRTYIMTRSGGTGLIDNTSLNPHSTAKLIETLNTTTVQSIKDHINDTIDSKLLGILELHEVTDGNNPTRYQMLTSDFQSVSDYIVSRSADIDVVTFSDLVTPNINNYTPVLNKSTIIFSNGTSALNVSNMYDEYMPNMTIIPSSDNINVNVTIWNATGDYRKVWNESSTNPSVTTAHTIGDFPAGRYINITVDGTVYGSYPVNSTGYITFTYSGGYSEHQFEAGISGAILSQITLTAVTAGTGGNSITTTESIGNASFGAGTLTGGVVDTFYNTQEEIVDTAETGWGFMSIVIMAFIAAAMFGLIGTWLWVIK